MFEVAYDIVDVCRPAMRQDGRPSVRPFTGENNKVGNVGVGWACDVFLWETEPHIWRDDEAALVWQVKVMGGNLK